MRLEWRPMDPAPRPLIPTSITEREAAKLRELATQKHVLEIGAAFGFSTILMADVAEKVDSIDPHNSDLAVGGTWDIFWGNLASYRINQCEEELQVDVYRESSRTALPKLKKWWHRFADLAFIDGSHLLEDVLQDLDGCESILKPGGLIAVHDYGEDTCPDVARAARDWLENHTAAEQVDLVDTLMVIQQ